LAQYAVGANPALAATVFPLSGAPKGTLASRLANVDFANQMSAEGAPRTADALRGARLAPGTLALARQAYRREPPAVDALRVVAMDQLSKEQDSQALATLEGARALSRRSTGISVLLLDRYGREGRVRDGMEVLDELLRRGSSTQGELLVALAANVGR